MTPYQDAVKKYGGKRPAARALGIPDTTLRRKLLEEKHYPYKREKAKKSKFTKIVYFCDAHNQPGVSHDRFIWLAKFVNDQKPDILIDGGDFDDFQSLCSHERNETYKGRLKPSAQADLEASAKARELLSKTIKHGCRKLVTLGNHEYRLKVFEDNNPEMYGIPTNIYFDILKSNGWEWYEYGEHVTIEGVNFTHIPFNTIGKPVGGETACKQVADKSLQDVVFGHTHKLDIWNSPKFGHAKSTTAFNGGCFMPLNYVPPYARDAKKEFWYGCHVLMIADQKIKSIKSWHISELEMMYV